MMIRQLHAWVVHIAKHKLEDYIDGMMKSWYFTPEEWILQNDGVHPIRKPSIPKLFEGILFIMELIANQLFVLCTM